MHKLLIRLGQEPDPDVMISNIKCRYKGRSTRNENNTTNVQLTKFGAITVFT